MSKSIPDGLRRHQAARRARSREAILEAAADLFIEKGYAGTTMADLAEAAEVSPATLYKAFGSKEDLFRAMVARELASAQAPFGEAVPDFTSAREAGHFIADKLKHVFTETRITGLTRLAFAEGASHPELEDLYRTPTGEDLTQALSEKVLQALIDQGLFRPCHVPTAVRQFLGMVTQALVHEPQSRGSPIPDLDAYLAACVDLFCDHYSAADENPVPNNTDL